MIYDNDDGVPSGSMLFPFVSINHQATNEKELKRVLHEYNVKLRMI